MRSGEVGELAVEVFRRGGAMAFDFVWPAVAKGDCEDSREGLVVFDGGPEDYGFRAVLLEPGGGGSEVRDVGGLPAADEQDGIDFVMQKIVVKDEIEEFCAGLVSSGIWV